MVIEEIKAIKVKLDYPVFKEIKVSEEIGENQVKRASRASRGYRGFRVFRGTKVKKAKLVHRVTKVIKVRGVIKEIKEKLVPLVIKEREVIRVKKDCPGALEAQESQERRV